MGKKRNPFEIPKHRARIVVRHGDKDDSKVGWPRSWLSTEDPEHTGDSSPHSAVTSWLKLSERGLRGREGADNGPREGARGHMVSWLRERRRTGTRRARMVRGERDGAGDGDGSALSGAWRALCQVLQRSLKQRRSLQRARRPRKEPNMADRKAAVSRPRKGS